MTTDEIDVDKIGLTWDKPYFYLDGKIFIPKIYEINQLGESIPEGFNTVSLNLDGKVSAELDWKAIEEAAQKYQTQGLQLLWNLDLGLFDRLKLPLANQTQFLSLILSLEHLRDTLWKKFKDHTLGVCLYQGPANSLGQLRWDDQLHNNFLAWGREVLSPKFDENDLYFKSLFARDAVAEYLTLLANRMPDAMQLFAILDVDASIGLIMEAQLSNRERFERFHLITRKGSLPTSFNYEQEAVGVCLPCYDVIEPQYYLGLENVLKHLLKKQIPFRIIPEAFLIHEWDGLDYLIVEPAALSPQGKRKLQGFCAAGGTVVTLGDPLGVPHEITHNQFVLQYV